MLAALPATSLTEAFGHLAKRLKAFWQTPTTKTPLSQSQQKHAHLHGPWVMTWQSRRRDLLTLGMVFRMMARVKFSGVSNA